MEITQEYLAQLRRIHDGPHVSIYLSTENEFGKPVVLKVLHHDYSAVRGADRFGNEFRMTRAGAVVSARKALAYSTCDGKPALILEYVEGKTLREFKSAAAPALEEQVRTAIAVADAVHELHRHNLVHAHISSDNIVITPGGTALLIDFAAALPVTAAGGAVSVTQFPEGGYATIAPEQTGRTGRLMDTRTDLYALGVVLYEFFSGSLPFTAASETELIHYHIAKNPPSLRQAAADIPEMLEVIVDKLLAKNAEDRYQSAYGLTQDLARCLAGLVEHHAVPVFQPGADDFSAVLRMPGRLYGREQEQRLIAESFDRVCRGACEAILLSGDTGTGKSALAAAVRRLAVERGGYFSAGRYDIHEHNLPYAGLLKACSGLVDQLLGGSAKDLARWKAKILQAVGVNGALLNEAIPRLELIIGWQPPVQELGLTEGQIRFHHVLHSFLAAVAQRPHPLILFLDNLQWIDAASLNFLWYLESGGGSEYLLVIAAYRETDVPAEGPLGDVARLLRERPETVHEVRLGNLSKDAVAALISDALCSQQEKTAALADLVYEKTGGNALFTVQFLQSLYEDGLVSFNYDERRWMWDTDLIRQQDITDNVLTLMAGKIAREPAATQELLSLAACLGNTFNIGELAAVAERAVTDVYGLLNAAVADGLICPIPGTGLQFSGTAPDEASLQKWRMEFLHDRVRQAAAALIAKKHRKSLHAKIGRQLLKNAPDKELEERIFGIVDHLNEGFQYLTDENEKLRLAELNLIAGRKAKRELSYKSAIWYLSMGIGFLPADRWSRCYALTLDLYLEAVEAEYLSTNFERADVLSAEILQQVEGVDGRIRVYELRSLFAAARNQNAVAIKAGLEALELLDVHIPFAADEVQYALNELRLELTAQMGNVDSFADLPPMTDAAQLRVMRILMNLATPAHQADTALLSVIILTMILMSVRFGNSALSGFAYAWYGVLLAGTFGDVVQGYRFGQLSLKVLREYRSAELETKIIYLFNVFVRPWKEHLRGTLKPLQKVAQSGMSAGDLEYTYYSAIHYCGYLFSAGSPLEYIRQRQSEYRVEIDRFRLAFHGDFIRLWSQAVENLISGGEDPAVLRGKYFDAAAQLPLFIEQKNTVLCFCTLSCSAMLQYLFGNAAAAVEAGRAAAAYEQGGEGYVYRATWCLYYALALLAAVPRADEERWRACQETVAGLEERLRQWAQSAPMNFQHKLDLIAAERARVTGDTLAALSLYSAAIKGARDQGYVQEEALAYEREAEFYLGLQRDDIAELCVRRAADRYRAWGALRKADEVESRYARLLARDKTLSPDTAAIITASHMLSQEIRLEQLLDKIIRIVIENAGAEKGVLIGARDGELFIQAKGAIGQPQATMLQELPVDESGEVPLSVVNYVARTQMPVVLNDAFHDSVYATDSYITQHMTESLLCMPLVHQGKLSGLIYLENNLATNVFTPDRLELLKTLSAQAAISMENAGLYAHLENKIREIKRAEENLRESEQKLNEIIHGSPIPQFFIDKNHIVRYWNKALEEYSGVKAADVVGTRNHWKAFYPQERPCMADLWVDGKVDQIQHLYAGRYNTSRLLAGAFEVVDFFPQWGENGKWLYFTAATIKDTKGEIIGAVETLADITEQKLAEAALQKAHDELERKVVERTAALTETNATLQKEIVERIQAEEARQRSERRQADIIEHLPDPTFVVDAGRHIIAWNKAMEEITTVRAVDMMGADAAVYSAAFYGYSRPMLSDLIFQPNDPVIEKNYTDLKKDGQVIMGETTLAREGRKSLVLWVKATPLFDDKGALAGAIESIKDITDLRESERNYRQLFENAQEGIWVFDLNDVTLLVNRRMAEMLGYTIEEMQKQRIDRFMDRQGTEILQANRGRIASGQPEQADYEFIRKDGSRIFASIGMSPMVDGGGHVFGTLAVITDVTARIRVEAELKKNLAFLQVLIDAIPNPVFFKDTQGVYLGCNQAYIDFYGFDKQALIGKTAFDIFPQELAAIFQAEDAVLFTKGGIQVSETATPGKDGTARNIIFSKAVFYNPDGSAAGLICSLLDITEMKRIQKEKESFQSQLIQSSKMAAVGQMAAGVAHELNNPLTIIMGNMQYLLRKQVPQEIMKNALREVELASQRCKKIVSDLLEFSRNKEMELQDCAINEVIDHVVHLSSFQEYAKRVRIEKKYGENLPRIKISISRIEQVFLNLITNAAQAIHGEGTVTIETKLYPAKQKLGIIFSDTGEGIPVDRLSHIFEPFYTTKERGTGLGLSVCYNIIKQHGGDISAASAGKGCGAAFTIILPTKRVQNGSQQETS